jgi:peptidylprolyl isomerase
MNGKKFDSSIDQNTPLSFRAGIGEMILGFDEAVMGMKVGEKRNLYIPYYLAYGSAGRGIIPPKSDLMFEVHLLEIKD